MGVSFNKLVDISMGEDIPAIDVSGKVLEKLRCIESERGSLSIKSMRFVATISSIAASIIVIFAIHSYRVQQGDSVGDMMDYVSWVNVDNDYRGILDN